MDPGALWVSLALVIDVAFRVIALVVVPRNRRPQTAMAWLLAIFFIPYFGFLAFVAFGSRRLPKKRRDNQVAINEHLRTRAQLLGEGIVVTPEDLLDRPEFPRWLSQTVHMNERLGAMPMVTGNDVSFFPDYQGSLDEMTRAIDGATSTVHVEFYIMSFDTVTKDFFQALERAGNRGVTVRVLYDQVASARIRGYKELRAELDRLALSHVAM
ncbi:MAG: PLDc N-terminal domain-containing protein [Pontimonas sp.]